jgi:Cu+-exporting ATPase
VLLERHAFRFLRRALTTHPNRTTIRTRNPKKEAAMNDNVEIDPVCGMEVDPAQAAGNSEYEDRVYWFCSHQCKQRFDLCPSEFAEAA